MVDSGASCNFMSLQLFKDLQLSFLNETSFNVRLANGGSLQTCGQCRVSVDFGVFKYHGVFQVLPCNVPLILGMSFLGEVKPFVAWSERFVYVNGKLLPSTSLERTSSRARLHSVPLPLSNQFATLENRDFSNIEKITPVDLDATPAVLNEYTTISPIVSQCTSCSKKLLGNCVGYCSKCYNRSFTHLEKSQCMDDKVPSVTRVRQPKVCGNRDVEFVSLQSFTRSGRKGDFEFVGLLQAQDFEDAQSSQNDRNLAENDRNPVSLHFTHRTAHGGDASIEVETGQFQQLATDTLANLKCKFGSVFADPTYPLDRSECPVNIQHQIRRKDETAAPPKKRLYPLDSSELAELKVQLKTLLESERIRPSNSPYGAPILFAKKKDSSALRMCIDYRLLNQQSIVDSFPLPRIDELLQRLNGAKVFSKLDLRDGYHQIPMADSDIPKTAFSTRYGTYEFVVMPFGLSGAPGTFQRFMNQVFFDLLDEGVVCYLDDILIYSRSVDEHLALLDKVFKLLQCNKMFLKESKCHLFLERVNFLGHIVSARGVEVERGKTTAIRDWPVPKTLNELQQFLGLANYYRRFVLRFSEIASPLSQLTRKGHVFSWTQQHQLAFDTLKKLLCSTPVLKIFDKTLKTRVVTDASNYCVGAVLEQQAASGAWHPVEYFSKRLSSSERNYSATDREFVAIRLSLDRWRYFLIDIPFVILTDHAALTYLASSAGMNRRNARWLEFLSQYQFEISHIKGRENIVADTLSRVPGTEFLSNLQLCSFTYSLGVRHCADMPHSLCDPTELSLFSANSLYGVISIHERETFRHTLLQEQLACKTPWFEKLRVLANSGDVRFQFRNDLLCRLRDDHFCPIIPDPSSSTIQVVLSDLHDSALGGHLGRRKLLSAVQKRFYWQNMSQSVVQFCRKCVVCQQNKSSTQKPIGKLQPLEPAQFPFQHVSMDFIMQLPVSDRGFDAVFTIVDRFSRMVRFIPCGSNITAQQAADLFFEHWICRFGVPQKIISDRDPRFQSVFWQSLFTLLNTRIAMSSSYHPQTDGLTERFHRSVEQILRCYASSRQQHWCSLLSQCEFALNSTVQDSHNAIPFEVVFGRAPAMPLDLAMPVQSPAAQSVIQNRQLVQSKVQELQAQTAERMKRQADRHRRDTPFSVGQKVWLSTAHLPLKIGTRKLAPRWTGPFPILARVTAEAWKLKLPPTFAIHPIFHSAQLKPATGSPRQPPPVALETSNPEYEVEAILGRRVVRGQDQFLVRWKGYSQFDDTWEPRDNLKNAQKKLADFLQTS